MTEDRGWFVVFIVIMPVLWFREHGWLGVPLYVLLMVALVAVVRGIFSWVRGVSFWTWE